MARTPQEIVVKIATEVKSESLPKRTVHIELNPKGTAHRCKVIDAETRELLYDTKSADIHLVAGEFTTATLTRLRTGVYSRGEYRSYTEEVAVVGFSIGEE